MTYQSFSTYMSDIYEQYPRTTQVAMRWGKYVLAQIFLEAIKNEDYELCKEIKETYVEFNFDENHSREEMIASLKQWAGGKTDDDINDIVDESLMEAKWFLGLNY